MEYIVGIDEVGRGPIAGSVVVCGYAVLAHDMQKFEQATIGVKDSKKLSSKKRQGWIKVCEELGGAYIQEFSASQIDEFGISYCLQEAVRQVLVQVEQVGNIKKVFLDGGLHAPDHYEQETIIKGDESVSVIALASIHAKEYRDTQMIELGKEYPEYGFEKHKGYGTKAHYEALEQHGLLSMIHRVSFLKKIL